MAKWSERSIMRKMRLRGGREYYARRIYTAARQIRGLDELGEYPAVTVNLGMRRVEPSRGWRVLAGWTLRRLLRGW